MTRYVYAILLVLVVLFKLASPVKAAEPTYVLSNGVVSMEGAQSVQLTASNPLPFTQLTPFTGTFVGNSGCYYNARGQMICPNSIGWGGGDFGKVVSYGPSTMTYSAPATFGPCKCMTATTACTCTPTNNCGDPNCPVVRAASRAFPLPMSGGEAILLGETEVVGSGPLFSGNGPIRGFFHGVRTMFQNRPRLFGGGCNR